MRIASAQDLETGTVLGKSLYLPNRQLLLGAGFRITEEIKRKLLEKGYAHVYIMEEGTEDILPEDVISEELRHEAKIKLVDNVDKIKNAVQFEEKSYEKVKESLEKGNLKNISISYDMKKIIQEIIHEISLTGAKFMNTIMFKSKDDFFFDHAINTTVLAILIAKKYKYTNEELSNLSLGCFLHDIGKVIIYQINNSKEKENDYYREHPTFGYLLLKNDPNITPLVLQTVNQHHEQQDGQGFPIGLKGTNSPPVKNGQKEQKTIFRFAEICSVADSYDRILMNPVEKTKLGPQDVIKSLLKNAGTVYNKHIIETLTQIIAIYPVGSFVRITSIVDPALIGSYGVVAKMNENNLSRPTIIITTNKFRKKIKPVIIDTSKLSTVELTLIL